jgi:hypothetical protein
MTPLELTGIALYSESFDEIMAAVRENLETIDEFFFGACAHAMGHAARRFGRFDRELLDEFRRQQRRFSNSVHVKGAIVDMESDFRHFLLKEE